MTTILYKDGYLIPMTMENKNLINLMKTELKVEPFSPYNFNFMKKQDKSFKIYKEIILTDDDLIKILGENNKININNYLLVPKYYGLNKLGKPVINKENNGIKIDINFSGTLRDNQKIIIVNIYVYY